MECGGSIGQDMERGESYCRSCGLVQEEDCLEIDFTSNNSPASRLGSLVVGYSDANGKYVSRKLLRRLKTSHRMVDRTDSSSFVGGKRLINSLCSQGGLPRTIEDCALELLREALKERALRGRSVEQVVPFLLYIACRLSGVPRTIPEIAELTDQDIPNIRKGHKVLLQKLGLELPPIQPRSYVPRFISRLGLSQEIQRRTLELLDACNGRFVARGCNPLGVVGASIYLASFLCNEPVCQKDVRHVVGVAGITLRKRTAEIQKTLDLDDRIFESGDAAWLG